MELIVSVWRGIVVVLIVSFLLANAAHAEGTDGTWRLVMRKLPNGTELKPPAVYGMSTTKNGVNQLIVFGPTPEGKPASVSSMSKWEWSETEVAVTPLLLILDDGSGKTPFYAVGGETKRASIRKEGTRILYQHPTDPPFISRDGDKMTATLEGAFVDYWERVK
jgi:hypothetical protein